MNNHLEFNSNAEFENRYPNYSIIKNHEFISDFEIIKGVNSKEYDWDDYIINEVEIDGKILFYDNCSLKAFNSLEEWATDFKTSENYQTILSNIERVASSSPEYFDTDSYNMKNDIVLLHLSELLVAAKDIYLKEGDWNITNIKFSNDHLLVNYIEAYQNVDTEVFELHEKKVELKISEIINYGSFEDLLFYNLQDFEPLVNYGTFSFSDLYEDYTDRVSNGLKNDITYQAKVLNGIREVEQNGIKIIDSEKIISTYHDNLNALLTAYTDINNIEYNYVDIDVWDLATEITYSVTHIDELIANHSIKDLEVE